MTNKTIHLIGFASGLGAADSGTADGPLVLKQSAFLKKLGMDLQWDDLFIPELQSSDKLKIISTLCHALSSSIEKLVMEKKFFVVLGGDHTSAIGTWSGVSHALQKEGDLGLIWFDAHMDSHTLETTPSGNYHGMPLACLLGYGEKELTHLFNVSPKLKPENICLIGVRSFEQGEAELLKRLNVKIFFMDDIKARGLKTVMQEALQIVTRNTVGFGVSLDIDCLDPRDAPGTGAQEANGIQFAELKNSLSEISNDSRLIGVEIAEFDPHHDQQHMTEKLIAELITFFTIGVTNRVFS